MGQLVDRTLVLEGEQNFVDDFKTSFDSECFVDQADDCSQFATQVKEALNPIGIDCVCDFIEMNLAIVVKVSPIGVDAGKQFSFNSC